MSGIVIELGLEPYKDSVLKLVDTHCHIDFAVFDHDRDQVVQRACANNVTTMVVPATQQSSWRRLLDICKQAQGLLYPALGLHPMFLDNHTEQHVELLEQALEQPGIVAVGEIGLDFYQRDLDRDRQMQLCALQLEVAKRADLPVILHVRKAYDQMLGLLKTCSVAGGISHAFNGSLQHAHKLIDAGFKLGFGGTLTYANARRIHELARKLPMESIVLETDAPDMVVNAWRGTRNSPEYLPHCLQALAQLRQQSIEEVAAITTRNAYQCLRLAD